MTISFTLNGAATSVEADGDAPLLAVLRNDLGLSGAKFGCGLGQCGACTVILDGDAVRSCILPLSAVEERTVTTIEGLGTIDALHPVQKAFLDEQAAQCGYCTAGMIMSATALLDRQPVPSEQEIRTALDGNLCRCAVYDRILKAVQRASREMKS